jgi:predicted branched-subunit amino acid permease
VKTSPYMTGNEAPFRAGFMDSLAFTPSTVLWGAIFGAAAVVAGLPGGLATLMSATVYSGAAQLAVLKVLHQPALVIFLTSLLISLRFVPMALALGARLRLSRWQRALLSPAIVDAAFALAARRRTDAGLGRYLAGTLLNGYASWLAGTVIGVLLAPLVPGSWGGVAEGVVVIVFIALTVEVLVSRMAVVAAGLGGLLAVLLAGLLPAGAALAVAALAAGLCLVPLQERVRWARS